ncbi:MAG: hypothetical protein AAGA48_33875 [Myxococcota bacterium]
MWGFLWASTAFANCPEQPEEQLLVEARQVMQAFDASDADLLEAARDGLRKGLPCVDRPMAPATLRVLHRAMALIAYADRDRDASTRAWAALRALDPTLQPDSRRFGPGHGIWTVYEAATPDSSTVPLTQRSRGGWLVDGERTDEVPLSRAFVLHAQSRKGLLVHTGYYFRPEDVPTLDFDTLDPRRRSTARRVVTGLAGVGLLAVGAATMVSAARLEADLKDGTLPAAERPLARGQANRRYAAGSVLGGVGFGLAVVGFSIRW